MSDRHHARLHDTAPWDRRATARNTGVKCERSELPRAMKGGMRTRRDQADLAALRRDLADARR